MNINTLKKRFKVLLLLCISIGFFSCEYSELEPPSDLPTNVSFKTDVTPIFNQSCNAVGCHNSGGISPDLSEENAYTELMSGDMLNFNNPEQSTLYLRMVDVSNPMPMTGILSKKQTDKILVWIKEGAQNN